MKIVMVGDIHIGARNSSSVMLNHTSRFFNNVLIPYMKKHKLKELISPGDLFESRKTTNNNVLHEARHLIFDKIKAAGINFYVSIGNHDLFFRESVQVNTPSLLLKDYSNIRVIETPTTIKFDNCYIDFIPWICEENKTKIKEFVRDSVSTYCFGHFEFSNFEMYKGIQSHGGMSTEGYTKYKGVFSGHYHTKSNKDNIRYLGTPTDSNWSDYNDAKGFWVLDTETNETEFIQNPYTVFDIINYDDVITDYSKVDVSLYSEKYIKVIVINKTDYYGYDLFLARLYKAGCNDIKIIEDLSEYNKGSIDDQIDLTDTKEILNNYVESLETDTDKDKVKMLLTQLYLEAINLSVT